MHQRNNSHLLGLLVYFIGVSQLPMVSASPVNVSTIAPTTITGKETIYPSSTLTSSSAENTALFASISASNTTTQFVTAYTSAVSTVSQGNNSSTSGIFPITGYVSTSAANATTQLVTIYPTGAPTTSQRNMTVDLSSTVATSSTVNTPLNVTTSSSNSTTQFVTAYTIATPKISLQSGAFNSSSTNANSSEGLSTAAPNTTMLITTDHTTTSANETSTIFYAETTLSVSEKPSTTSMSINESTPEKTTTRKESSTTGTTSTPEANSIIEITATTKTTSTTGATSTPETASTTGTATTTQCIRTTTKKPKKDCVIDDADILDQLRKELLNDEVYKEEMFNDTTGNPTFGIGHKITPDDPEHGKPLGTKIPKERIKEAFKADVKATIGCKLFDDFQNLPKEVQLIILNMRFNLGHSGLEGFKKFREAVNNGDWDKAADEMVDSKWYKQVPNRAKRLEERMRKVEKKC